MVLNVKQAGALVLRLIVGLALLGCARMGSAQGTWSVISLPQQPGEVMAATRVAVDGAGSVYVADYSNGTWWSASTRIQKRDPQGHWSVIATYGTGLGQVVHPAALAADAAGSLYVLDYSNENGIHRLQQRDAQGHWSLMVTGDDDDPYQYHSPITLAVDAAGNLYVLENGYPGDRIRKRNAQGNWTILASGGTALGQVQGPTALAADAAGNLYVADTPDSDSRNSRIQRRDLQGHWSVLTTQGSAQGQVDVYYLALAADAAGNLYVADDAGIERRDTQGHWLVLATGGDNLGQVQDPTALAADAAGNLYIVDLPGGAYNNSRIQRRDLQGHWSPLATRGEGPGRVLGPAALAADRVGNLYVADQSGGLGRIQQRDPQGNWSVLAVLGPNRR